MRKRYERMVTLANQGAREMGFADVGAMWRSKYDMPPEDFASELDRLWQQVRPLYVSLHAYVRWQLAKKYGASVGPRDAPDSRASAGQHVGAGLEQYLSAGRASQCRSRLRSHGDSESEKCRSAGHGSLRRAFFHLARIRALAADVLGAVAVHQAARPRSGLPRQRVGHRLRRGCAHQDVHRADGRGFLDHPPRTRPQFLSARLRQSAAPFPQQRQRRIPRGHRRHHRALGDAGISEADRLARFGAARLRRTSACCCTRRSTKSRSCRLA